MSRPRPRPAQAVHPAESPHGLQLRQHAEEEGGALQQPAGGLQGGRHPQPGAQRGPAVQAVRVMCVCVIKHDDYEDVWNILPIY